MADRDEAAASAPRSPGSSRGATADEATVRALLAAQAPSLSTDRLAPGPTGWDNVHWLLDGDLAVRLPRRRLAVQLVRNEALALPRLAPRLPLPVPVPVVTGEPLDQVFPWPWSVVPWFDGERADLAYPPVAADVHARALGGFLRALHVPAEPDAPHNPFRSIPLRDRAAGFEERAAAIARTGRDRDALGVLRAAFDAGVEAAPHAGPSTWIHGDLHPGNQLVARGGLAAIVDWGDVAAGDPAADLATAWWSLPVVVHGELRAAYGSDDADLWARAAGWAAIIAAFLLDQGPRAGDPAIVAMARRTVARLADGPGR